MRNLGVRSLGLGRTHRRLLGFASSALRPRRKLVGLVGQDAAAGVELEKHRLTGLAREPQLPAGRVDPLAVEGHGHARPDCPEAARLDEPHALEQPDGLLRAAHDRGERSRIGDGRRTARTAHPTDDDRKASEPRRAGPLEKRERMTCVVREERRGPPCERSGDGLLVAGLDLQRRQREPFPFGREGACRGCDALALGERSLERCEALPGRARALGKVVPLGRRRPREGAILVRALLELGRAGRSAPRVGPRRLVLVAEAAGELRRGLVPCRQALAGGTERNEHAVGGALSAGHLANPAVHRLALGAHLVETSLCLVGGASIGGGEEGVGVTRSLRGVTAPARCVARGRGSGVRGLFEDAHGLVGARFPGSFGLAEIVPQAHHEAGRRLAADGQPLARSAEAIEGGERRLASAGRVGQLDLGALALGEDRPEPLLRAPSRERRRRTTLVRLCATGIEGGNVDPRDPRSQAGDLVPELLRALRRRRLERQRPEALAHLVLDVPRALDLRRHARELQLGAVPAAFELAEPCRLLDERSAVLGPRGEDRVDLPLAHDRVHRAAEADVRQELDEVGAANRSAVDEVLTLAPTHEPPHDRDLGVVELAPEAAVLVVEDELDLTVLGGLAGGGAAEEHVVRLLGAHLRRCQRARRPDDRVRDVRLAGAVRPDHDGHPGLELHLDRVRERLEAAQLDGAQVHRARTLTAATDGGSPHRRGSQADGG